MTRIILVEDNCDFRAEVSFHLDRAGFEVVLESDGSDLEAQLAATPCDMLVLDLGLPIEDGLDICRRLRRRYLDLGIVMLTARDSIDDRLAGLRGGADAYLVKPVDMRELVEVLLSVKRRLTSNASFTGIWTLIKATMTLQSPDGTTVSLTVTERALLQCLADTDSEPVDRNTLAAAISHPEPDFDHRRLEVAFSRLRRKLSVLGVNEALIRPVRGRGYVLTVPVLLK